jgi:hypothetical protein
LLLLLIYLQVPAEDGLDLIGEELEEASAAVEGLSQVSVLQTCHTPHVM